jgi:hypothetical protein
MDALSVVWFFMVQHHDRFTLHEHIAGFRTELASCPAPPKTSGWPLSPRIPGSTGLAIMMADCGNSDGLVEAVSQA